MRPIPLMTSSRTKSAPYLSHTDFMALRYPFGGGTQPVVAPTTVSAKTVGCQYSSVLSPRPRQITLTPNDRVRTQLDELILQLLPQPFDILLLRLVRLLESRRVRRGDVVEVLIVHDAGVGCAAGGVQGQT